MTATSPLSTGFQAEWPKHLDPKEKSLFSKICKVAWFFLSLIVFPIGLCRLAYWRVRDVALNIAIPGSVIRDPKGGEAVLDHFGGEKISLTAPDGARLEAAFFPGLLRDKAVIFGPGTAMQWETSARYIHLFDQLGLPVLVINPRGTGTSTGSRYEEGYGLDTYTGYEHLIQEKGLDPENILHFGFSMGGGYGALGASYIQQKYPEKKINAINFRSYGDLHTTAEKILAKRYGCLACVGRCLLGTIDFRIHAKEALDTLKGKVTVFFTPSDGIIAHAASMAKALEDHPKRPVKLIEMHAAEVISAEEHLRAMDPIELLAAAQEICDMLNLDLPEQVKTQLISNRSRRDLGTSLSEHLEPLRVYQVG